MLNQKIRTITFDLDDTLWDAKPVLINAEKQLYYWLEQHASKVTQQFTLEELAKWRWDNYKKSPQLTHQISQLRIQSMKKVMALVGYDEAMSEKLAQASFECFLDARHQITPYENVIPILSELKKTYILGTLTNGNTDVNRLPIGKFFDFSFRAEQLNAGKPGPELFLAAQKAAQCKAHEILHIGDHIEYDVLGAHNAGCHALWFNPKAHKHPDSHLASMEVQQLSDIPQIIYNFEKSLDVQ